MEFRMPFRYSLQLERDEFLLITKALRGTLTVEEKELAVALQEKMMLDKHHMLLQTLEESQKTVDNINKSKIGK